MLMLICIGCIAGFIAGWFAVYLTNTGNYYAIFGQLKFKFVMRWANSDERILFNSIIDDPELSAFDVNHKINNEVYGFIAKRKKIVYFLGCPYCLGNWLLVLFILFALGFSAISFYYFPVIWITGIAAMNFSLNFAK